MTLSLISIPVYANALGEDSEILSALNKINSISNVEVVYSKTYFEDYPNAIATGFPKQITTSSSCFVLPILVAPIDPAGSEFARVFQLTAKDLKKSAVFSAEVWSEAGLKLSSIYSSDSRTNPLIQDSSSFWAPTTLTQVPLKICDETLPSVKSKNYVLILKAGWALLSKDDIREFERTISVTYLPVVTAKKTTITCVKGKLIKKVTAVKPVCPSGYKKK